MMPGASETVEVAEDLPTAAQRAVHEASHLLLQNQPLNSPESGKKPPTLLFEELGSRAVLPALSECCRLNTGSRPAKYAKAVRAQLKGFGIGP